MALTTLNLSGIKAGDSLNISVSQGGLTAGPYSVGSWGGGGDDAGPITIDTGARSAIGIAPEGVRFSVDLSSASFDTAGPTGSEVFDPQLHDLIYFWDFDDAGTWTAPVNVLTAWKNRSVATGPIVTHLFRDAGSYDVSVLVIEPSSGKTAAASTTVSVLSPDTYYSGTATICVNPEGDSDFTGAPAGAATINSNTIRDDQTFWTDRDDGTNRRWLFKRGATYPEINLKLDAADGPYITLGAYGSGDDPILNIREVSSSVNGAAIQFDGQFGSGLGSEPPEVRVYGLDLRGNFDSTDVRIDDYSAPNDAISHIFLNIVSDVYFICHDCSVNGIQAAIINSNPVDTPASPAKTIIYLDNFSASNFGSQYPLSIFNGFSSETTISIRGCSMVQPGDALVDVFTDITGGVRSFLRVTNPQHVHIQGCDFFTPAIRQAILTLNNTPQGGDGRYNNVHNNSFEGGVGAIGSGGNTVALSGSDRRTTCHNTIFDGNIWVSGSNSQSMFYSYTTGMTIRNNLCIVPDVAKRSNAFEAFVDLKRGGTFDTHPAEVGSARVAVYNNTVRIDRTKANNSSSAFMPQLVDSDDVAGATATTDFTNIVEENNIWYIPDSGYTTPDSSAAPLTSTQLWASRNIGFVDASDETRTLETAYATPAGAIKDTKPNTGSAARNGATTGLRPFTDITGASRYGAGVYNEGTVDDGAWQVS